MAQTVVRELLMGFRTTAVNWCATGASVFAFLNIYIVTLINRFSLTAYKLVVRTVYIQGRGRYPDEAPELPGCCRRRGHRG